MQYEQALAKYKSTRAAAKALGMKKTTFFDRLAKERAQRIALSHIDNPQIKRTTAKPTRYIFTAAVRGANVHQDFLDNLKAYAAHIGAELVVGPLMSITAQRFAQVDSTEFHQELVPLLGAEPIIIGDKMRYSPELNLSASMVQPLQGLQTYTKKLWGIFPHTKISLQTVATHKQTPTKFIATTGAVTHPNYTPTKAGFRANFDHQYGAAIVEVTKNGVWFRHVTPTSEIDGTFYDLDNEVRRGAVTKHKGVSALVYGDIHVEHLDPVVAAQTWAFAPLWSNKVHKSLTELLKPETQVYHDLMDMTAENYHELDDVFARFGTYLEGDNSVKDGFVKTGEFINHVVAHSVNNVVVESNHDYFIKKWLLKFDPSAKEDFENIIDYYKMKVAVLERIEQGGEFSVLELALKTMQPDCMWEHMQFLLADESFEIHNIELAYHGHMAANGRRGSRGSFKFVTEKSIVGHMHSPWIESGSYVVGTSSRLKLSYNKGPSSWSNSHAIIYPHGGRTLVTLSDNRFWADQPFWSND